MHIDLSTVSSSCETRREFLKKALAAAVLGAGGIGLPGCMRVMPQMAAAGSPKPWYRRTFRWGQTNITEIDPTRYDIPWWRQYWKRTHTQGVIINAGGIVAYYPSRFPLHHQAEYLKGRDLYGELAAAAHTDGLAVLARMDSSRAHEDFYRAHPEWFCRDATGRPFRSGDLYTACINGPYYEEYLPDVLREIIDRTHPEGLTDNSWSGLDRNSICHCDNCAKLFHAATSQDLPREKNWNDPAYRQWMEWSYVRRLEIWDLNNRIVRAAGGPDCLWIGMNGGGIAGQCQSFRDDREIYRRAEIVMLDFQARTNSEGFQANAQAGRRIHSLLGWDKLIPESMALYQAGTPTFRVTTKPEPEVRLWMLDGFAGGIQPWWHHVGAYEEDRRAYHTVEPIFRWHQANEKYLVNRQPIASVGVVWSRKNTDYFGRDNPAELVELPARGLAHALLRARIPWLPLHLDDLPRDGAQFSTLILPNLAAISDDQCRGLRQFVEHGGSLIATGTTSLRDEWGDPRHDYGLADLFGAHRVPGPTAEEPARTRGNAETLHTYLRLLPERRAMVDGPKIGDEPPVTRQRHPVLQGFDETDLLPYGGQLEPLTIDPGAEVLLTFVPPFPAYPPETSWMRQPRTDIPGLILRNHPGGGRVAFLPADLDSRYGRDNLPDHADLLANLVRWAAGETIPLKIEGHGLVDCQLYRQADHLILHLVNLTNADTWRAPVDDLTLIGPLRVKVRLPVNMHPGKLKLLVSGDSPRLETHHGWATLEIKSILDHEVAVF